MLIRKLVRFSFLTALLFMPLAFAVQSQAQDDMRDAALLVGNATPFGPTDGVLRYDGLGKFIDNMVPVGTAGLTIACCIRFGPDQNLYVGSPFTSSVLRFNGVTGAFIDAFVPAGSGGLALPLILLFHDRYLYVGDTGVGAIRRYDAKTGAYVDNFIPDSTLPTPFDLQHFVFGPDGNLYVAAQISFRVLRFNGTTGAYIDDFIAASEGFSPSGMTVGPDGLLYVGSTASGEVRRYDVHTGNYEVFIPAGTTLSAPVGITFGPDGKFYATAVGTSEILRYDGITGQFLGAFVPTGSGGLTAPRTLEWRVKAVCHMPPGNPGRAKSLTVGYLSARDHLQHGDTLGPCQ